MNKKFIIGLKRSKMPIFMKHKRVFSCFPEETSENVLYLYEKLTEGKRTL